MLILASTSQLIRMVTDAATDVDVVASYVDRSVGVFTPDSDDTQITTATTTTIVASPAASTERNVKGMTIRNRDTTAVGITVQWYNGVISITLITETLNPGQEIVFDAAGGWQLQEGLPRVTRTVIPGDGGTLTSGNGVYCEGVYVTPKGAVSLFVECLGAGAPGGNCTTAATNSAAAGGGSSGAYITAVVDDPDDQYQWLIINYLTGSAASSYIGTVFGVTSWDSGGSPDVAGLVIATTGEIGGDDAVATIHTGGIGGSPTQAPAYNFGLYSTVGESGTALAAAQAVSGRGGSSPYGVGGQSIKNTTSAGNNASGHGAGGSGACIISGGAAQVGGRGSPGLIIVTEFYQ